MAAREEKLDQGYQGYQKWGGIQERTYLVEHQSRQETVWGRLSEARTQDMLSTGNGCSSPTSSYEFRADNKGLFINDKAMQGFRIASGFRKAHRLTA